MEIFKLKQTREKLGKQYAVMELIVNNGYGVYQNLIAICNTREEAALALKLAQKNHMKETIERYGIPREEYNINIDENLDTVYDYSDDDGNEYHLLACTPQ